MKYVIALTAVLFLFIGSAQAGEVYSANGFACSSDAYNSITCKGRFPQVAGAFQSVGERYVSINYLVGGVAYGYNSLDGCLVIMSKDKTIATNRNGIKKTFKSRKKAKAHCEKVK